MLIIFDCDGVLVDSEVMVADAHAAALRAAGLPFTAEEVRARFTGMTDREMYAAIEAESGLAFAPDYFARLKEGIEADYRMRLRPVPGIAQVLAALDGPVCVASSSTPDKLRLGLTVTGLYERFAPHVFSASQVARGKPAPDLFLFAAREMGHAPADCLVIEDSLAGVQAARAAGMRVIGFTGGAHCGPGHGERLAEAGAWRVAADMGAVGELLAGR